MTELQNFKRWFYIFIPSLITNFMIFPYYLSANDYLNPYTITFKNPKTLQMFNIIVLYHYVMTFLIGVIIFTFIFIFLSFFRTYYFFNYKTFYKPQNFCSFSEFLAHFRTNLWNFYFIEAYNNLISYVRGSIIKQKNKHLVFYKNDIKNSLNDQITHAPLLEFLWVIFPALILVAIAYPSIILLYYNEAYVEPVFNITVIGNQWYWTYEYNDFNLVRLFKKHISNDEIYFRKNDLEAAYIKLWSISLSYDRKFKNAHQKIIQNILTSIPQRLTVDCNMIIAKDPKFLRLLTTDQCLVIPAKTPIRFLITSTDVIHSWAIPSYGIKIDAVPGRINQQILTVPLMGTSWGQCSELCGVNHAFMPIEIKVLAFSDFLYFIQLKIKEILLPYLVTYYKMKADFTLKYVKKAIKFRTIFHQTFLKDKNPPFMFWKKDEMPFAVISEDSLYKGLFLLRYEKFRRALEYNVFMSEYLLRHTLCAEWAKWCFKYNIDTRDFMNRKYTSSSPYHSFKKNSYDFVVTHIWPDAKEYAEECRTHRVNMKKELYIDRLLKLNSEKFRFFLRVRIN